MECRLTDSSGDLFELRSGFGLDMAERSPEPGRIVVRNWLRGLLGWSTNRDALRRLVSEDLLADSRSLDDDALTDWLWNRIDQGRLRIVRIPRPDLVSQGTEQAEDDESDDPGGDDPLTTYWIEIELIDMEDGGVPGERYIVKTPDGKTHEGSTGGTGVIRLLSESPGSCEFTFPDLDEGAWEPA